MSLTEKLILRRGDEIPLHVLPKGITSHFDQQKKYLAHLKNKPSAIWFYPKDITRMNISLKDKAEKDDFLPVTELVYQGIPIRKFEEGATEQQENLF